MCSSDLSIVIVMPQPLGIRALILATILRLIFSVGLEPTLFLLGAFNVSVTSHVLYTSLCVCVCVYVCVSVPSAVFANSIPPPSPSQYPGYQWRHPLVYQKSSLAAPQRLAGCEVRH